MDIVKYGKSGKKHTVNKKTATKYDGKVFDRLLEHFYNGGSIPQFCRNERISRQTLDNWIAKYDPEGLIKPMAKLWAEGWWMEKAHQHLITYHGRDDENASFDTKLYIHTCGGRFGHTSDKVLRKLAEKINQTLETQQQMTNGNGALATEPEYDEVKNEDA